MDFTTECENLKAKIKSEGLDKVAQHIDKNLDKWKSEPVRFAVIGASNVGKSTFINAIRNCKRGDPGYAEIGSAGNTTEKCMRYEFPDNPQIELWDLPGYGTTSFRKEEYEKRMKLQKFDYALLFVANITQNDVDIGKELQKLGIPFCYVRSKLDESLRNARAENKPEELEKYEIMSKSIKILEENKLESAPWFLISSRDRHIGQFDGLVSHIQNSLSDLKADAVIFSLLGDLTDGVIDRKYQSLKKELLQSSLVSSVIAAVPVPGVDMAVNVTYLAKQIQKYKMIFGFDQCFVKERAKLEEIASKLHKNSLLILSDDLERVCTFIIAELGTIGAFLALQSTVDPLLPVIGSLFSGAVSGFVTYRFLSRLLDTCRHDALVVYSHLMTQPVIQTISMEEDRTIDQQQKEVSAQVAISRS